VRAVVAGLVAAACASTPATTTVRTPEPMASVAAPRPSSESVPREQIAMPAADAAPAPTEPPHRLTFALGAGRNCSLLLRAQFFEETKDAWLIGNVRWLATEAGDGCAAGVLFDAATETSTAEEEPIESLQGGAIAKPGGSGLGDAAFGGLIEDVNFDGNADLCVVALWGAYNYSQRCFVFDAGDRRFVRTAELEDMLNLEVDARRRVLKSSHRAGGPVYEATERRWIDGKLVTTRRTVTHLGEKPDGTALPSGKSWVVEHALRGGKLVIVREGVR
jgi:hypothetical protein